MADLAQLEAALVKADAAGNTDDARVLAAEIRRVRAEQPSVLPAQRVQRQAASTPRLPGSNPAEVGGGRNYAAGIGGALVSQGRGLLQTMLGDGTVAFGPMGMGVRVPAFADAAEQLAANETEQRQRDVPLNATGAGLAGKITGYVAPLLTGAGLARGTALAPAMLPNTIRGAAAQGGALGYTQPLATGEGMETRLQNAGLGALAGGGVQAGIAGAGKALRGLGGLLRAPTRAGMEDRAGRIIQQAAQDPARIMQAAPSPIPGVQRSLAEESLDPGIAQLQRQFPQQMAEQQGRNNTARIQAIREEFRGADEMAVQSIQTARDQEARAALRGLRSKSSVAMEPVAKGLDALIAKQQGRPAVQSALKYVRDQLDGVQNADQAYNVRKTIGDLMEGRLSGDLASATTAKQELMTVRYLLDREMRKAVPQWGQYLRGYQHASREMDQVRAGMTLLDKGAGGSVANAAGDRTLTPAAFHRLTNNPNQLMRTATGFPKAKAENLTEPQRQLISQVRDDLRRVEATDKLGRGTGSPTAQNLQTQAAIKKVAAYFVPESVRVMTKGAREALAGNSDQIIASLLADPQKARQILARLAPRDRVLIERELARYASPVVVATTNHKQ
jgi:hypothetical protein